MTASKDLVKVSCPTCKRDCAADNWSCDLFDGKAYCPLCTVAISLHEFMTRAGMMGRGARAQIRPAAPPPRPQSR